MKNKPLTLLVRELDDDLIAIINKHQLPAHTVITELQKIINVIIAQDEDEINKYLEEQGDDNNVQNNE